jgi:ABC-type transport system substrate-binding protein
VLALAALAANPADVLRVVLASFLFLLLAACSPAGNRGPVEIAVIGEDEALFDTGVRLSVGAQHLRAATNEGLVALDHTGQVVPAIAERWIVTDDGLSYIFRLRDTDWPDGEPVTASDIRRLLQETIRQLEGTSLGLDLAKLVEIRAMTGRVIELRLSGPMPEFLRLLAQPELGFALRGSGTGPMIMSREEESALARLSPLPPQERGLPARENWQDRTRQLEVEAMAAQQAVDAFAEGEVDVVMNGTIADFPMIQLGPLSRGAVQVDPALGLFGLVIRSEEGLLAEPARREALSMAIDREAVIQPFGLGGWRPATWIVPPGLFAPQLYPDSRWPELGLEQRREVARQRIAAWRAASDEQPAIRVALPEGPGAALLFDQLAAAWRTIGVTAARVGPGEEADLELHDRLARYSSPRWFLNQFNCRLQVGLCSQEADALVRESLTQRSPEAKQALLAEAHAELMAREVFIPLGIPVRWSLVRGSVEGYLANPWGLHPLLPLSQPPS